jgi:hypothetical protein
MVSKSTEAADLHQPDQLSPNIIDSQRSSSRIMPWVDSIVGVHFTNIRTISGLRDTQSCHSHICLGFSVYWAKYGVTGQSLDLVILGLVGGHAT